MQKPLPYSDIPKLPDLVDKYLDKYNDILAKEVTPVLYTITECQNRVMGELETKEYKVTKYSNYNTQFECLKQDAESCNNVSRLRGYGDKAAALREKLLQEMANEDARRSQPQQAPVKPAKPGIKVTPVVSPKPKPKRILRIKTLAGVPSWQIKNEADIEKVVEDLRTKIKKELKNNTILQIEL